MSATELGLLVGKFFHTTSTCPNGHRTVRYQGHVIGTPAPEVLMVEYFSWITGCPHGQKLVTLVDFMSESPVLYDSDADMTSFFELRETRNDECTTDACGQTTPYCIAGQ